MLQKYVDLDFYSHVREDKIHQVAPWPSCMYHGTHVAHMMHTQTHNNMINFFLKKMTIEIEEMQKLEFQEFVEHFEYKQCMRKMEKSRVTLCVLFIIFKNWTKSRGSQDHRNPER